MEVAYLVDGAKYHNRTLNLGYTTQRKKRYSKVCGKVVQEIDLYCTGQNSWRENSNIGSFSKIARQPEQLEL